MAGRYDYVKYDDIALAAQQGFKAMFTELTIHVEALDPGAPKILALQKLEEAYMWIGKALRDGQLQRLPAELGSFEREDG
jgi:hypothetical protein